MTKFTKEEINNQWEHIALLTAADLIRKGIDPRKTVIISRVLNKHRIKVVIQDSSNSIDM